MNNSFSTPDLDGSYFFGMNAKGDVMSLTDSSGNLAEDYEFDPWGQIVQGDASLNNVLFAAREYDSEMGLYFNRARYYDPGLGRFTQILTNIKGMMDVGWSLSMGYEIQQLKRDAGPVAQLCALHFVICPSSDSKVCYIGCKAGCDSMCRADCERDQQGGLTWYPCLWLCKCFCNLGCAAECGCIPI